MICGGASPTQRHRFDLIINDDTNVDYVIANAVCKHRCKRRNSPSTDRAGRWHIAPSAHAGAGPSIGGGCYTVFEPELASSARLPQDVTTSGNAKIGTRVIPGFILRSWSERKTKGPTHRRDRPLARCGKDAERCGGARPSDAFCAFLLGISRPRSGPAGTKRNNVSAKVLRGFPGPRGGESPGVLAPDRDVACRVSRGVAQPRPCRWKTSANALRARAARGQPPRGRTSCCCHRRSSVTCAHRPGPPSRAWRSGSARPERTRAGRGVSPSRI